jgi:hypothetical protein
MFKYWPKISAAIDRDIESGGAEKGVHIKVHCFYAINLNEKEGSSRFLYEIVKNNY